MELPLPNSWVEMHAAMTHFPIVLLLVSAFFEAVSLLPRQSTERRAWYRQVSLYLLILMVISAVPSLLTGYMTGRGMPRPPLGFDAHWKAAVVSSLLAAGVLLWRILTRDQMRSYVRATMLTLFVGSIFAVTFTGHLGGEMVLGGDYEPVPVVAAAPTPSTSTPSAVVRAPGALESAAGKMEVAAGKLDDATERLALAAGAANAARAQAAAQRAQAAAQRAQAAAQTSTQAARSAQSARPAAPAPSADEALARRLEVVASRYERVADRLGAVAERLAAAPLPTAAPIAAAPTAPATPGGRVASNPNRATPTAPVSPPAPGAPNAQLVAAGRRVYLSEDLACSSCHKINGSGGRGGPDLTGVGSRHPDLAWQIAHLRNPAHVTPGSRMPAYNEDDLNAHDMDALAAYMVSLK